MSFDFVPGEVEILRANLRKDKWMRYRCTSFGLRICSTVYCCPCAVLYGLFGGCFRQQEADSFELVLTNQNIHFRQKLYQCGVCCQSSNTVVIPLDRIQDISLVSNWVGDCCGIVDTPGEVYQLHVETAARVGFPELRVYCIENPRDFKKKVLEAKNNLSRTNGQSKQGDVQSALANVNQEDLARILSLLSRQNDATVHYNSEPAQEQH